MEKFITKYTLRAGGGKNLCNLVCQFIKIKTWTVEIRKESHTDAVTVTKMMMSQSVFFFNYLFILKSHADFGSMSFSTPVFS